MYITAKVLEYNQKILTNNHDQRMMKSDRLRTNCGLGIVRHDLSTFPTPPAILTYIL